MGTARKQSVSVSFTPEDVALDDLKPHPRNYQQHPDDELAHIMESIKTHGFYRNVVIARDGTILAGHGVTQAARKLGYTHVPVIRTPYAQRWTGTGACQAAMEAEFFVEPSVF
jgi:ParB-like chromosome segregation protein Spo0J